MPQNSPCGLLFINSENELQYLKQTCNKREDICVFLGGGGTGKVLADVEMKRKGHLIFRIVK